MSYIEVMLLCSHAEEVERIPIEKYLPMVINKCRYPVIDDVNAWLVECHELPLFLEWGFALSQEQFDSMLIPELVGTVHKQLMFYGVWSFLDVEEFLAKLRTLPWKTPDKVYVLFSFEENPLYSGTALFSTTAKVDASKDNSCVSLA